MFYAILFAVVFDGGLGALICSYGSECLTINDEGTKFDKNWWGANFIKGDNAPCFDDWTKPKYVRSTENCYNIPGIYIILSGVELLKRLILSISVMFHCRPV